MDLSVTVRRVLVDVGRVCDPTPVAVYQTALAICHFMGSSRATEELNKLIPYPFPRTFLSSHFASNNVPLGTDMPKRDSIEEVDAINGLIRDVFCDKFKIGALFALVKTYSAFDVLVTPFIEEVVLRVLQEDHQLRMSHESCTRDDTANTGASLDGTAISSSIALFCESNDIVPTCSDDSISLPFQLVIDAAISTIVSSERDNYRTIFKKVNEYDSSLLTIDANVACSLLENLAISTKIPRPLQDRLMLAAVECVRGQCATVSTIRAVSRKVLVPLLNKIPTEKATSIAVDLIHATVGSGLEGEGVILVASLYDCLIMPQRHSVEGKVSDISTAMDLRGDAVLWETLVSVLRGSVGSVDTSTQNYRSTLELQVMYLLKRIVATCDDERGTLTKEDSGKGTKESKRPSKGSNNIILQPCHTKCINRMDAVDKYHPYFVWSTRSSSLWNTFFIILEALTEYNIHMISPALEKLQSLLDAVDSHTFSIVWVEILLIKGLLHPNTGVSKLTLGLLWGIKSINILSSFSRDFICRTSLLVACDWRLCTELDRLVVPTSFIDEVERHFEEGQLSVVTPIAHRVCEFYRRYFSMDIMKNTNKTNAGSAEEAIEYMLESVDEHSSRFTQSMVLIICAYAAERSTALVTLYGLCQPLINYFNKCISEKHPLWMEARLQAVLVDFTINLCRNTDVAESNHVSLHTCNINSSGHKHASPENASITNTANIRIENTAIFDQLMSVCAKGKDYFSKYDVEAPGISTGASLSIRDISTRFAKAVTPGGVIANYLSHTHQIVLRLVDVTSEKHLSETSIATIRGIATRISILAALVGDVSPEGDLVECNDLYYEVLVNSLSRIIMGACSAAERAYMPVQQKSTIMKLFTETFTTIPVALLRSLSSSDSGCRGGRSRTPLPCPWLQTEMLAELFQKLDNYLLSSVQQLKDSKSPIYIHKKTGLSPAGSSPNDEGNNNLAHHHGDIIGSGTISFFRASHWDSICDGMLTAVYLLTCFAPKMLLCNSITVWVQRWVDEYGRLASLETQQKGKACVAPPAAEASSYILSRVLVSPKARDAARVLQSIVVLFSLAQKDNSGEAGGSGGFNPKDLLLTPEQWDNFFKVITDYPVPRFTQEGAGLVEIFPATAGESMTGRYTLNFLFYVVHHIPSRSINTVMEWCREELDRTSTANITATFKLISQCIAVSRFSDSTIATSLPENTTEESYHDTVQLLLANRAVTGKRESFRCSAFAFYSLSLLKDDYFVSNWLLDTIQKDQESDRCLYLAAVITASKVLTNPNGCWYHYKKVLLSFAVLVNRGFAKDKEMEAWGAVLDIPFSKWPSNVRSMLPSSTTLVSLSRALIIIVIVHYVKTHLSAEERQEFMMELLDMSLSHPQITHTPCMPNSKAHRSKVRLWQLFCCLTPLLRPIDEDWEPLVKFLLKHSMITETSSGCVRRYIELAVIRGITTCPNLSKLLIPLLLDYTLRGQVGGSVGVVAINVVLHFISTQEKCESAVGCQIYRDIFPHIARMGHSYQHIIRIISHIGMQCILTKRKVVLSMPLSAFEEEMLHFVTTSNDAVKFQSKNYNFVILDIEKQLSPENIFCMQKMEGNQWLQDSIAAATFTRCRHLKEEMSCALGYIYPVDISIVADMLGCMFPQTNTYSLLQVVDQVTIKASVPLGYPPLTEKLLPCAISPSDDFLDFSEATEILIRESNEKLEKEASIEENRYSSNDSTNFQTKVKSWWTSEIYNELHPLRTLGSSGRQKLIIVGTLLENPVNIAGLCRCGDIFAVEKIIVRSKKVFEHPHFVAVARSAELWIPWEEVPEIALCKYLIAMREQGYTVIGVEQTADSVSMGSYEFPESAVVVLGSEGQGIPAAILPYCDVSVEIPQFGLIRSLNVHVTGAIAMYEYTKQKLMIKDQ